MTEIDSTFRFEVDTVLNPWFTSFVSDTTDKTDLTRKLNTLLSIGYSVTTMTPSGAGATTPPPQQSSYEIGKQAEDQLEELISIAFPDDQVINNAQRHHESDLVLKFDHGEILIESKNYASVVPSKEVTKFHADLQRTGVNYGLFVSFGQSICGKPNKKLVYECKDNKHVIYIPAYKPNSAETKHLDAAVVALNFLRTQCSLKSSATVQGWSDQFVRETTEELACNLNECLCVLEDHLKTLNRKRFDIAKNQDDLVNHVIQSRNYVFENLYQLYDHEKQIIEQLSFDVNMQIDKLRGLDASTHTSVDTSAIGRKKIIETIQHNFPKNKKAIWMMNEIFSFVDAAGDIKVSQTTPSASTFVVSLSECSERSDQTTLRPLFEGGSLLTMKITATTVKVVEMNEQDGNPERAFKDQACFSAYLRRLGN